MTIVTLGPRGRVTLPKPVLHHLGVEQGGKVSVEKLPGRTLRIRALKPQGGTNGCSDSLQQADEAPIWIEEMIDTIGQGSPGEQR